MDEPNPFLAIEPDATCPPELREQLISEIDLIRDTMTVIELYVGEFFKAASILADPPVANSGQSF
ncbi:hypothetical protein EQG79_16730 [Spirosoma sordidisoli]|uniref:Uncharacterized protein n=1 Tax=Spirosoma sordidisoli TaxID=2502893 RepID=A0A4Q2UIN2_9BACT|nr:hypothetical protein EQG79_16730 [Spirosoma sordidisoli]